MIFTSIYKILLFVVICDFFCFFVYILFEILNFGICDKIKIKISELSEITSNVVKLL
jgi:hypothetical protein